MEEDEEGVKLIKKKKERGTPFLFSRLPIVISINIFNVFDCKVPQSRERLRQAIP